MEHSKVDEGRAGLGKEQAAQYSMLLRNCAGTISVKQAAQLLDLPRNRASMLLSTLAKKGWLKRIYYGIYIAVPIESPTSDIIAQEPFVIANSIFSPCYISGMNAANYWGLTDQLFRVTTVMTQKLVRDHTPTIAGLDFAVHSIREKYFFGLKSVWFDSDKIDIADPSRLLVDMAMYPQYCGGIHFFEDVLRAYYKSEYKDMELLKQYMQQALNGAAFKRLGFLFDKNIVEEKDFISFCYENITQGYAKLSPAIKCEKLNTKWRLWVA